MDKPIMKKANGTGVELQLTVLEGDGIPVVLVHGLTANCRCRDVIAVAVAFADTPGHPVYTVDPRGRGMSDKPSSGYSEEHHILDLDCMILRYPGFIPNKG